MQRQTKNLPEARLDTRALESSRVDDVILLPLPQRRAHCYHATVVCVLLAVSDRPWSPCVSIDTIGMLSLLFSYSNSIVIIIVTQVILGLVFTLRNRRLVERRSLLPAYASYDVSNRTFWGLVGWLLISRRSGVVPYCTIGEGFIDSVSKQTSALIKPGFMNQRGYLI